MVRSRTYKTEGVVLKQIPLGEADRILTLYTPDMGKVRAVAKGVRRTKSKLGGNLELLSYASVSVAQGRNLDVVTEAVLIQSFRGFREDLPRLSRAIYIAELVDSFSVEHSASYAVFKLLLDALGWLETTEEPDLLLRHLEIHLLDHSGYRPELYSCVDCRSRLEPMDHPFDTPGGGVLCPKCRVKSGRTLILVSLNAMKVLRFLQREQDFSRVAGLRVSPSLLSEVERLLRAYIRFLVEREIKSAAFVNLVSSSSSDTRSA